MYPRVLDSLDHFKLASSPSSLSSSSSSSSSGDLFVVRHFKSTHLTGLIRWPSEIDSDKTESVIDCMCIYLCRITTIVLLYQLL